MTLLAWSWGDACRAEVTFDGSIGGAAGSLSGPDFVIPSSRGEIAGSNLFHSFGQFNLAGGESATFSGPANVGNILARVTGGASTINGKIQSDIHGANLFLINQAGIMFGSGAKVDVSGAFNATTANHLQLEDGRQFSASPTGDVTMLTASPAAFGFLDGVSGGEIRVDGVLSNVFTTDRVPSETFLGFDEETRFYRGIETHGGDLHLAGRSIVVSESAIHTEGGDLRITSVGANAAVVRVDGAPPDSLPSGSIVITNSSLNASGSQGGEISIRGGQISIDGTGLVAERAFYRNGAFFAKIDTRNGVVSDAGAGGSGGSITVSGKDQLRLSAGAMISSRASTGDFGAGDIVIEGGSIEVLQGAQVSAFTNDSGDAGTVMLTGDSLRLDGDGSVSAARISVQSNSNATGAGGTITVDVAGAVEIVNGGQVVANTFGQGNAGEIVIQAGSLIMDGGTTNSPTSIAASSLIGGGSPPSRGEGGNIRVEVVGEVEIRNRATIEAATGTEADAGTVHLNAGNLTIIGANPDGLTNEFLTGILGITSLNGLASDGSSLVGGRGGNIFVNVANAINLRQGGHIDTSSFGGGAAGVVEVRAGRIIADRAGSDFFTGIGSDTEAFDDRDRPHPIWNVAGGRAGDVSVWADESITLLNGANISSSSAGSGDAGNIVVTAPRIDISGSGSDKVFTPGPESGIVALTEGGDLDDSSEPDASIPPSTGNAGSVTVNTSELNVFDGGKVSAEALGTGTAGDVTVNAGGGAVNVSTAGRISARSELEGDAGLVMIIADEVRITDDGTLESLNRGSGEAGGVELIVTNLELDKGSISTVAEQSDAGNITVTAGRDIQIGQGSVSASAGADGGSIIFSAGRLVLADNSKVEAEAQGNGGNILINDATYFLSDHSLFNASAIDGDGGNIGINTGVFLQNLSVFDVSSQFGASGAVQITPLNSLSGSEGEVEASPLDETDQLQPECTQRLATKSGSFIRSGKGGSPRLPGGYLPSVRLIRNEGPAE